jgi:uncharacterized protein YqeY
MRDHLTTAMRARDKETVRVLRTTLSVIANAEAQPSTVTGAASLQTSGRIAGASAGLGSADVARRDLTDDDVLALVTAERDELLAADRPDDAAVLETYLQPIR